MSRDSVNWDVDDDVHPNLTMRLVNALIEAMARCLEVASRDWM